MTAAPFAIGAAAALTAIACTPATAQMCPSDLYIGYYLESAVTNPEDPTPGSIHLLLPKNGGAFTGEMFFTYEGCQSRNVGAVVGNRANGSLSGTWSGTVDGTQQNGAFVGSSDDQGFFSGTYSVAKGKQSIVVEDCIEYIIAPSGRWSLFPILQALPDDGLLDIVDDRIVWTPVPNSEVTQCQLIDLDEDNCNEATTTIWQDLALADQRSLELPKTFLINNSQYAIACAQFDDEGDPLAFSKRIFNLSTDPVARIKAALVPILKLILH